MFQKFAVLGLLNVAPMTGYLIKKNLEASISKYWPVSYGGLYPALHKLQEEQLITSHGKEDDGRGQITYAITVAGHEALMQWLLEPRSSVQCKDEFMLKLFLSKDLKSDERIALAKAYVRHKEERLADMRALLALKDTEKVFTDSTTEFVIDYTMSSLNHEIELLESFVKAESKRK